MIVVTVYLKSAISPTRSKELARMEICNDDLGVGEEIASYDVRTLRGRDAKSLDKRIINRTGKVLDYPRLAIHVWHLVYEALVAMKYNRRPKNAANKNTRREPPVHAAG